MGKRLTQAFKLLEKDYRKKVKKDRWEKDIPTFKTFDIPYTQRKNLDNMRLLVTDVLNVEAPLRNSRVIEVSKRGSDYIISSIVCPLCSKILVINRHWNCYFCESEEHGRKIFEIAKVEIPTTSSEQNTSGAPQTETSDKGSD